MALSLECMSSLSSGEEGWDDEVGSSNLEEKHIESSSGLPGFPLQNDEMISLLVHKELEHLPDQDYVGRYRNRALDITARQDAIRWIHTVQAHYKFKPLTAYLSINYLDRFLASYQLPQGLGWPFQLLSVACLSLAAKMEETLVPDLLDLQVGDAKFVFEARTIQRMELLVLTTLKWRLRSITPFNYIDYLLYRLQGMSFVPQSMISRSIELIINTNRVIDFLDHRPSSIAAAAVMCASEEVIKAQSADYKKAILSSVIINKERIISCYNLMQELVIDSCWAPGKQQPSSGVPQSPIGVLDAAACVSCDSTENTSASAQLSAKKRKTCDLTLCVPHDQRW